MTKVKVDAENLWFILQQLRHNLDNKCPDYRELDKFQQFGFYFQEYEIIKQMEQQIREVI